MDYYFDFIYINLLKFQQIFPNIAVDHLQTVLKLTSVLL